MDNLLQLLIYLLVAGVVIYVVYLILGMIAIPSPIKNIIYLILGVVFLIWILRTLGIFVF